MALNMDQKRASFALEQVAWLKKKEEANNIRTQSAKLIALILNSGFLQAMDFANTKLNGAFVILNNWFAEDDKETGPELSHSIREAALNGNLNGKLAELDDINEYRRAMQEAVVFLGWLKSKAEGKKMELENRGEEQSADRET